MTWGAPEATVYAALLVLLRHNLCPLHHMTESLLLRCQLSSLLHRNLCHSVPYLDLSCTSSAFTSLITLSTCSSVILSHMPAALILPLLHSHHCATSALLLSRDCGPALHKTISTVSPNKSIFAPMKCIPPQKQKGFFYLCKKRKGPMHSQKVIVHKRKASIPVVMGKILFWGKKGGGEGFGSTFPRRLLQKGYQDPESCGPTGRVRQRGGFGGGAGCIISDLNTSP